MDDRREVLRGERVRGWRAKPRSARGKRLRRECVCVCGGGSGEKVEGECGTGWWVAMLGRQQRSRAAMRRVDSGFGAHHVDDQLVGRVLARARTAGEQGAQLCAALVGGRLRAVTVLHTRQRSDRVGAEDATCACVRRAEASEHHGRFQVLSLTHPRLTEAHLCRL